MRTTFLIYQLRQIGNIGANEIVAIKEQPSSGFKNKDEALYHLNDLFKVGDYPFTKHYRFTVLEIIEHG